MQTVGLVYSYYNQYNNVCKFLSAINTAVNTILHYAQGNKLIPKRLQGLSV